MSLQLPSHAGAQACCTRPLLSVFCAVQAMVFGVALNSKKNTLVALLIAANFAEIKGAL